MKGYMQKKGERTLFSGGNWKKRFFTLEGAFLKYYTEENGVFKGDIDLNDATILSIGSLGITIEGPWTRRKFEFEAFSSEDQRLWMHALCHAAIAAASAPPSSISPAVAAPSPPQSNLYPSISELGTDMLQPAGTVLTGTTPAHLGGYNTQRISSLPPSPQARDRMDSLADLFSIIQTLEHLEKLYIRDAVPTQVYHMTCLALIAKYKVLMPIVQDEVASLDEFMHRYQMNTPLARHRLSTGFTAVSEHGSQQDAGSARGPNVQLVFEVGQHFITLMDALKLGQLATDQLQPILSDLIECLNKLGQQQLPGRELLVQWLVRLNNSKANDELSEADARQMLFEVQAAYDAFHKSLH